MSVTELILAVAISLSALTLLIQGLRLQRSIDRSRQAFTAAALNFSDELAALKRDVAELERHEEERKVG